MVREENCGLWTADCGLEIAQVNPQSEIRNPQWSRPAAGAITNTKTKPRILIVRLPTDTPYSARYRSPPPGDARRPCATSLHRARPWRVLTGPAAGPRPAASLFPRA